MAHIMTLGSIYGLYSGTSSIVLPNRSQALGASVSHKNRRLLLSNDMSQGPNSLTRDYLGAMYGILISGLPGCVE